MPKHKHADLIKQWADGAEIEAKTDQGWVVACPPFWYEEFEYRVKTATLVQYCPVTLTERLLIRESWSDRSEATLAAHEQGHGRGQDLRILRIEINPENFTLVSATLEQP